MKYNYATMRVLVMFTLAILFFSSPLLAAFCSQCGKKASPQAKFCQACGTKLGSASASKSDASASSNDLNRRLQGKRYMFFVHGTTGGDLLRPADNQVAAARLTMTLEKKMREILKASVFDGGSLAKIRKNAEATTVLTGGSASDVIKVLNKYNSDFLVRALFRTAPVASVGGQCSATASVTLEIISRNVADKPVSISSPVMGTDDHPAKLALGAFDAGMLALNYAADQVVLEMKKVLNPPASVSLSNATPPRAVIKPTITGKQAEKFLTGRKPRVAVFKFEDKAGHDYGHWKLPEGLADMLITQLMKEGSVKVYERTELDAVMKEKKLQVATGARGAQGVVTGVEYLIKGTISEYSYKTRSSGGGVGFRGIRLGGRSDSSHVAIDLRIIHAATGQVIASKRAEKKNTSKGIKAGASVRGVSFGGSHWSKLPIGKTTRETMDIATKQVLKVISGQTWSSVIIMRDPAGLGYLMRGGTNQGVRKGMGLFIKRKGKSIVDPETGESLGASTTNIGTAVVVEVRGKISVLQMVTGATPVRGDYVTIKK